MSYLNDTSVVSQFTKPTPNADCMNWLTRAPADQMFLSVLTILEIRTGIEGMPMGKRRTSFSDWLDTELPERFQRRILPVTLEIADDAGRLIAKCHASGNNVGSIDALIAATARLHGFTVATLNRKHFRLLEVPLVDF